MATEEPELSDQDEVIADLLGEGWTHQRVAGFIGVSTKTIQRRITDPDFSRVVSARRRERFGQLSANCSPPPTAPWTCWPEHSKQRTPRSPSRLRV